MKFTQFFEDEKKLSRLILITALAIGAVTLLISCFSVHIYRDSAAVYTAMTREFAAGNYKEAFHPGIPNLAVILAGFLSKTGVPPFVSMRLVSGFFYLASIPMIFLLMRLFMPLVPASAGALLAACAPKIIRFFCTGLIDSGKFFFMTAALYFLILLVRKKYASFLQASLLGAALGGLTLARSEGIGNAAVIWGAAGAIWLALWWKEKKLPSVLPLLSGGFVWLLLLFSRVLVNGIFCGSYVFDSRLNDGIGKLLKLVGKTGLAEAAVTTQPASSGLVPATWGHLLEQNLRGGYELYLIFGTFGLLACLLRNEKLRSRLRVPEWVRWNNWYWLFFLLILSGVFIGKTSNIAAYRYFLPNVMLLMVFTIGGICWIWNWCTTRNFLKFGALAGVAVFCVLQVINGLGGFFSGKERRRYNTGLEIGQIVRAGEKGDTAKVWFIDSGREWYFSEIRRALPVEKGSGGITKFNDFDYVILPIGNFRTDALLSRTDLEEIPLSPKATVRLFRKR